MAELPSISKNTLEENNKEKNTNYKLPEPLLKAPEDEIFNTSVGILQSLKREWEKEKKINETAPNLLKYTGTSCENWHYSQNSDDCAHQRSYSDHVLTTKDNNSTKPKKIVKQITFGSQKSNKVSLTIFAKFFFNFRKQIFKTRKFMQKIQQKIFLYWNFHQNI